MTSRRHWIVQASSMLALTHTRASYEWLMGGSASDFSTLGRKR